MLRDGPARTAIRCLCSAELRLTGDVGCEADVAVSATEIVPHLKLGVTSASACSLMTQSPSLPLIRHRGPSTAQNCAETRQ